MVDRLLAPSIPNWVARSVTEITIGPTGYETWARTLQYEHQTDIDAGDIPPGIVLKPNGKVQRTTQAATPSKASTA